MILLLGLIGIISSLIFSFFLVGSLFFIGTWLINMHVYTINIVKVQHINDATVIIIINNNKCDVLGVDMGFISSDDVVVMLDKLPVLIESVGSMVGVCVGNLVDDVFDGLIDGFGVGIVVGFLLDGDVDGKYDGNC
mmetsp:Transcript_105483/g.128766  ORF Transcript_105483/g.128766 Transcript_105483/m.128766 type:complete len:136 (-) Transcript_105483:453-860(-)